VRPPVHTHLPPLHTLSPGQARPQVPQFDGLLPVSTQAPLQSARLVPQAEAQEPALQTWFAAHA
jgi:hypothetical protein